MAKLSLFVLFNPYFLGVLGVMAVRWIDIFFRENPCAISDYFSYPVFIGGFVANVGSGFAEC